MTANREAPRWPVWMLAAILAVVGVVLAVALGSVWPLIAFFGLAVPLLSRRVRGLCPN